MILDPDILADLAVAITPKAYVRDAHGLIYLSRLTGRPCICVYDRAVAGGLAATPVVEVMRLSGFVDALRELNVILIATP